MYSVFYAYLSGKRTGAQYAANVLLFGELTQTRKLLFLCFYKVIKIKGVKKMETILQFVKSANSIMWNSLLLIILCGTGIYYTFRLRFIQVRKFGEAFKLVFSNIKLKAQKVKTAR